MKLLIALATVVSITSADPVTVILNGAQIAPPVAPPPMTHSGLPADMSSPPAFSSGYSDFRVRPTTEIAPAGGGAFRETCDVALAGFFDPVASPGMAMSHLHTFLGNTGVNPNSTSLLASGNSTCRGGIANRSSYWFPTLLDGTKPVFPVESLIYYKAGVFSSKVSADGWQPAVKFENIPSGLKMIAGDAMAKAPLATFSYRFKCDDGKGRVYALGSVLPTCDPGSKLYQEVFFPQCWDGVNLDSPDHKSHMSYAIQVRNAGDPRNWSHYECPKTHPKVLPQISFQISYLTTSKNLRLSSDADLSVPAGYTSHGDVLIAWEPSISASFVENCIRALKDCHGHLLGDGREIY
jgi:hypothetical protein